MLDSFIKVNKNYYPQTLLEECKYKIKNNKMESRANNDFYSSSSDKYDSELDREPDSEPASEPYNGSKNPFKKSDNGSKNPFKANDNEPKNLLKKSND